MKTSRKDSINKANVGFNDSLERLNTLLYESWRPSLFFDILPVNINSGYLDVILRNSGGSAAYNIKFKFEPDIYYYEESSLGNLYLFKEGLPFLENGQEIRFFYDTFASVIQRKNAFGPKKTKVTLVYNDSLRERHECTFDVDLRRYEGILARDEKSLDNIYHEIESIRKQLNRGLLVKTLQDLEKERNLYIKSLGQFKTPEKGR